MSNLSKRYSAEFKQEAIKLAEKIGLRKAALDLGVTDKSLRTWIDKSSAKTQSKVKSSGQAIADLEAENRRLKKENEYLNKINEVLKKSTAIFSNDHLKVSK